jgi:2-dehydropantoate 2-reductase
MFRDVEAHRPTESDQILGDLLRRATSRSVAAPLLGIADAHLRAYEAGRQRMSQGTLR